MQMEAGSLLTEHIVRIIHFHSADKQTYKHTPWRLALRPLSLSLVSSLARFGQLRVDFTILSKTFRFTFSNLANAFTHGHVRVQGEDNQHKITTGVTTTIVCAA